jgi:hypothetical protein
MAAAHLGTTIQRGGQKHCAVQDALVTLQLYSKRSTRVVKSEREETLPQSLNLKFEIPHSLSF